MNLGVRISTKGALLDPVIQAMGEKEIWGGMEIWGFFFKYQTLLSDLTFVFYRFKTVKCTFHNSGCFQTWLFPRTQHRKSLDLRENQHVSATLSESQWCPQAEKGCRPLI